MGSREGLRVNRTSFLRCLGNLAVHTPKHTPLNAYLQPWQTNPAPTSPLTCFLLVSVSSWSHRIPNRRPDTHGKAASSRQFRARYDPEDHLSRRFGGAARLPRDGGSAPG